MNSRTLIRELSQEIQIGLIKSNGLQCLCDESNECLENDPIISIHFNILYNRIKPYLIEQPQPDKEKDEKRKKELEDKKRDFLYLSKDFSVDLERRYWECLSFELLPAIVSGDKKNIKTLVVSLLSDLIDKGWPIETLFKWHEHFLSDKNTSKYTFEKNLHFMFRYFSNKSQEFEVTLRLMGSNKLVELGSYGDFIFTNNPCNIAAKASKKFTKYNDYICFTQIKLSDSDFLSAAINAKESFEQFVDLLRFDFEPSTLKIDQVCHVRRLVDDKVELPIVKTIVPNPNEDINHSDFKSFIHDLITVSKKPVIEESSNRKIRGSIRQYRFGRDSDNFKDKFLNWWMGLETMCHIGRGDGIGEIVSHNVTMVMVLPYLHRLLLDTIATVKYAEIDWHQDLKSICSGKELDEITVDDLLEIIHSQGHRDILLESCKKSELMYYRCDELFNIFRNPDNLVKKIKTHHNHLLWHLSRLYRIRCCIVHGSDIRFRLSLFTANLEFYLKQATKFVLTIFSSNDHILNLEEIYSRTTLCYNKTIADLSNASAGKQEIRNAVFASITN
ncbi:hypothetical protein [Pelobacter propionicus]|nr:hypothetical protein [Pelobacter propionicus]